MLSAFFVLAETTGDVADAGKAIALALGIGLGALGAGIGIGNIFGSMIQAVAAGTATTARNTFSSTKIRPMNVRISMWPASMLAKRRTESDTSRMN